VKRNVTIVEACERLNCVGVAGKAENKPTCAVVPLKDGTRIWIWHNDRTGDLTWQLEEPDFGEVPFDRAEEAL
jgi:hypothetical protein